ncbi:MAG TPA: hypothetical protein VMI73_28315 [Trebonia sp.]|nr:hypothetical protein [Trebonia sp.]
MSELNDMTCAELADVAAELALGVLTGRERAVAIAHLDTCDACREHVRQLMATGEQLRELLPPAEPSAGFETRVLERLGLPVPAEHKTAQDAEDDDGQQARSPRIPARTVTPRQRRAGRDTARPGAGQPGAPQARPEGARPDGTRRPGPGRMRRVLAAAGVALAVVVAGLGGWRLGVATAPPAVAPASAQLTSANLVSANHQHVGQVFVYSGIPGWMYMSVDMGTGNGAVTCQVIGEDGRVTTIGSFRLADGYGAWGAPVPAYLGELSGARLVADNGSVVASGSFSS